MPELIDRGDQLRVLLSDEPFGKSLVSFIYRAGTVEELRRWEADENDLRIGNIRTATDTSGVLVPMWVVARAVAMVVRHDTVMQMQKTLNELSRL